MTRSWPAASSRSSRADRSASIVGGIANFHKLPHTLTEVNNGLYNSVVRAALDRDDLDLYGVHAAIDFTARLRGTERFDSVPALITQMHEDVAQARTLARPSKRSADRHARSIVSCTASSASADVGIRAPANASSR